MATVAETLVETLAAAGIDTVFGLPGGEVVEILDALRRRNLRFVFVHNESSAVFMADAMARITGKPGVVLTTLGPGATNAVAGVAHAYLDRSPVLVITAQKPDVLLPDYTHQVLDLHALYTPITKGSFKVTAANVQATMHHALQLAQAGRPGPVHLQISNEEATLASGESHVVGGEWPVASDSKTSPITVEKTALARTLLSSAQKPLIVAGLGLEPEQPYGALCELAEAANAPVIMLPKAKGAIPDNHPLAAGVIGLTRTDPVYEMLDEADCIIAVGFDVVELVKKWDHLDCTVGECRSGDFGAGRICRADGANAATAYRQCVHYGAGVGCEAGCCVPGQDNATCIARAHPWPPNAAASPHHPTQPVTTGHLGCGRCRLAQNS